MRRTVFSTCTFLLLLASILFPSTADSFSDQRWEETAATLPPWGNFWFDGSPQGVADDSTDGTLVFSGKSVLRRASVSGGPMQSNGQTRAQATANHNVSSSSSSRLATPSYSLTSLGVLHNAIPEEWQVQFYDHIGDVDHIPGTKLILAPVEEKTFTKPALLVYNGSDPTTFVYERGVVVPQQHCPWVAFVERGAPFGSIVVSSEYDNVTAVYQYQWPSLAPVESLHNDAEGSEEERRRGQTPASFIQLEKIGIDGLMHVQGGVVRNDTLFLSTDQYQNPNGHDLFAFNLLPAYNGSAPAPLLYSFRRNFTLGLAEVEGLTVDQEQRMWVVTNFISIDPMVYTFEQKNDARGRR